MREREQVYLNSEVKVTVFCKAVAEDQEVQHERSNWSQHTCYSSDPNVTTNFLVVRYYVIYASL